MVRIFRIFFFLSFSALSLDLISSREPLDNSFVWVAIRYHDILRYILRISFWFYLFVFITFIINVHLTLAFRRITFGTNKTTITSLTTVANVWRNSSINAWWTTKHISLCFGWMRQKGNKSQSNETHDISTNKQPNRQTHVKNVLDIGHGY